MLVNEGLPNFILNQLRPHHLASKTVAILGMAFKSESDDKRDSLSYKLKKLFEVEAKKVCAPILTSPMLILFPCRAPCRRRTSWCWVRPMPPTGN